MITKSAILISAHFNISPQYSFVVQNQINFSPAMSYHCNLSVGFCILVVYCEAEAVRSAIIATAWLLVDYVMLHRCPCFKFVNGAV